VAVTFFHLPSMGTAYIPLRNHIQTQKQMGVNMEARSLALD